MEIIREVNISVESNSPKRLKQKMIKKSMLEFLREKINSKRLIQNL
jgi:hypothetical protein